MLSVYFEYEIKIYYYIINNLIKANTLNLPIKFQLVKPDYDATF